MCSLLGSSTARYLRLRAKAEGPKRADKLSAEPVGLKRAATARPELASGACSRSVRPGRAPVA
jgi:hypothetical protein